MHAPARGRKMSDPLSNLRFVFDGQTSSRSRTTASRSPTCPTTSRGPQRPRARRRHLGGRRAGVPSCRRARDLDRCSRPAPAHRARPRFRPARRAGPRQPPPAARRPVRGVRDVRVRAGVDPRVLGDRGGVTRCRVDPADDEAARHVGRAVRRAHRRPQDARDGRPPLHGQGRRPSRRSSGGCCHYAEPAHRRAAASPRPPGAGPARRTGAEGTPGPKPPARPTSGTSRPATA